MKQAVITFGRMNPPTTGHQKLVDRINQVASAKKATPLVYLSHSESPEKDPLAYNDKIKIAQRAFGSIIQKSKSRNILQVLRELQSSYDEITIVVGSDRVKEFSVLVQKYNGRDYTFDKITVVSAGKRDPDASDVSGMSASKLRALAAEGNFEAFSKGVPSKLGKSDVKRLYDLTRDGMHVSEENINEVLNVQQRIKKRQSLRRIKGRIALGRRRAKYKLANKEKLERRSGKVARQLFRKKLAGKQGERYRDLPISARIAIDRKLETRKAAIKRIAKRLMPKVRKNEYERVRRAREARNEEFMGYHTFVIEGKNIELSDSEFLEMLQYMFEHDIDESVQKNLEKKSDKYSIPYEQLEQKYLDLKKDVFSESEIFDKLNIWIIREAIVGAAQKRARDAIKREKAADKTRHDRAMDSARLADARTKNRTTQRN